MSGSATMALSRQSSPRLTRSCALRRGVIPFDSNELDGRMLLRRFLPLALRVSAGASAARRFKTISRRKREKLKQLAERKRQRAQNAKELIEIVKKFAPLTSPQLYDIIQKSNVPLSAQSKTSFKLALISVVRDRRLMMVRNPIFNQTHALITVGKSMQPSNPDLCPNTEGLQPYFEALEIRKRRALRKAERAAQRRQAYLREKQLKLEKS